MRLICISILLHGTVFLISCSKNSGTGFCKSDLIITETNTTDTTTVSAGITSSVKCYGPNLCYSFSHVEANENPGKIYNIKIKANIPCKPAVCLEAIYEANPAIKINTPIAGTYILNFYNQNSLFKSDTVIVN